jgi:hypothetical protein
LGFIRPKNFPESKGGLMIVSKSKISGLVVELNSRDETEAKRAASELDSLLYPNYGPVPRFFTVAEILRIDEAHYGAIRGSDVVEPLLETARSGTGFARAYACRVLGSIKDTRALPLLVEALSAALPAIRLAATKGLWFFREPSCVSALIPMLEDSSEEVRCSAACALGLTSSAEAVPALMKFYEVGSPKAKFSALLALGQIGDPRSLPLVRSALLYKVRNVRGAAKAALSQYDLKRRGKV